MTHGEVAREVSPSRIEPSEEFSGPPSPSGRNLLRPAQRLRNSYPNMPLFIAILLVGRLPILFGTAKETSMGGGNES
jgi:hypothetical protein